MAELNRLSATEALRQIAAGKITSEALVRDCLERIKQRYPNRRWLLPPVLDTISKIEGLSDAEFSELMKTFRYV